MHKGASKSEWRYPCRKEMRGLERFLPIWKPCGNNNNDDNDNDNDNNNKNKKNNNNYFKPYGSCHPPKDLFASMLFKDEWLREMGLAAWAGWLAEILCPHCRAKALETWYMICGWGSRLERLENSFTWETVETWSSSRVSGLRTFRPRFGTAFSALGADGVEKQREVSWAKYLVRTLKLKFSINSTRYMVKARG